MDNCEYKIKKYSSKLENEQDNSKREIYERKIEQYMTGGGCDYGGKSGIYVLFTLGELSEILEGITNDPSSAFNKLNSYLPGFQLKLNGNELKILECSKPKFPTLCIIPPTTYTDLFVTNKVPSIQYTSLPGTDVQKAKNDIQTYVDNKNKTIDEVVGILEKMKSKLGEYKEKRDTAILAAEFCGTKKEKFATWKGQQKEFNSVVMKSFMTKKIFSSDAIKVEPMTNSTLADCKKKHDNIMAILNAVHPTEYQKIKDIVENMTCVLVIDVGKNQILNVFDIKQEIVLFPIKTV